MIIPSAFRQILGLLKKHLENEWPEKGSSPLLRVIEQIITRVFWQTNPTLQWCRHSWQAGQLAVPELFVPLVSERLVYSWTLLETVKCFHSYSSAEWGTGKNEFCSAPCYGTTEPGWVRCSVDTTFITYPDPWNNNLLIWCSCCSCFICCVTFPSLLRLPQVTISDSHNCTLEFLSALFQGQNLGAIILRCPWHLEWMSH